MTMTRHHLIPRERKKRKTVKHDQSKLHTDRVLNLWRHKHDAWHILFHNMTLDEIIACLEKVKTYKLH